MKPSICILTAGRGSRLGRISEYLNKALLPLQDKAAISHIINCFPKESHFVIALGYLAEQVKAYLEIAHPDTHFDFVYVDPWEGPGSGPGYSLFSCRKYLTEPFFFTCADTLWDATEQLPQEKSWIGISDYANTDTERFCNIRTDSANNVISIKDKIKVNAKIYKPFVGLGFIKEPNIFFDGIKSGITIAGEIQISNGFTHLLDNNTLTSYHLKSWHDIGTEEDYQKQVSRTGGFDFSKENEAFYLINQKVIKFFGDQNKPHLLQKKIANNPSIYPKDININGAFLWYGFIEGQTLYQQPSLLNFKNLLKFCHDKLWLKQNITPSEFNKNRDLFYKNTLEIRVAAYVQKYKLDKKILSVVNEIDWSFVYDHSQPCYFHGDLQFDNIIVNKIGGFTLIDPRDCFGTTTDYGDLLYDLGKLYAGLLINFSMIKKTGLSAKHKIENFSLLRKELRLYCQQLNIPFEAILLMAGVIFIRMAPLHHSPFSHMLFKKGLVIIRRIGLLREEIQQKHTIQAFNN